MEPVLAGLLILYTIVALVFYSLWRVDGKMLKKSIQDAHDQTLVYKSNLDRLDRKYYRLDYKAHEFVPVLKEIRDFQKEVDRGLVHTASQKRYIAELEAEFLETFSPIKPIWNGFLND